MQKFKVNGQSVLKIEWKQMDGQTDGGARIANAVGQYRYYSVLGRPEEEENALLLNKQSNCN